MKTVKILEHNRVGNTLASVILRIQDPEERRMYRAFLESEVLECPKCHNKYTVGDFEADLQIDSPLAANPILAIATPVAHCTNPACKAPLNLSVLDYSAFPSVVEFLKKLQAKYQAKSR